MTSTFKPAGYNSVSPYFIVDGARRFIDLMIEVFDARETRRFERPDGTIMHAEIQIDDSVIMLSEATEAFPATRFVMHVYVPDADAAYAKAIAAGCTPEQAPKTQEGDPDRRGSFLDFAGNHWSVGTQATNT